jgi:hypothetical protein
MGFQLLRIFGKGVMWLSLYLLSLPVSLYLLYSVKNYFLWEVSWNSGWHTFTGCTNQCLDASTAVIVGDTEKRVIRWWQDLFPTKPHSKMLPKVILVTDTVGTP